MKTTVRALAGIALVLSGTACGDDATGTAELLPATLTGEWFTGPSCYPQCGITLVPVEDPADSLNLTVHSSTNLRLTPAGGFRLDISGARDTTIAGSARVSGNTLVLDGGTSSDTIDFVALGGFLDLSFRRTSQGDINGDGISETLRLKGRWQKR